MKCRARLGLSVDVDTSLNQQPAATTNTFNLQLYICHDKSEHTEKHSQLKKSLEYLKCHYPSRKEWVRWTERGTAAVGMKTDRMGAADGEVQDFSNRMTSMCPFLAARCRGDTPLGSEGFGSNMAAHMLLLSRSCTT